MIAHSSTQQIMQTHTLTHQQEQTTKTDPRHDVWQEASLNINGILIFV